MRKIWTKKTNNKSIQAMSHNSRKKRSKRISGLNRNLTKIKKRGKIKRVAK